MSRPVPAPDVLVLGGGPAGATAATFLAHGGCSVQIVEREAFPRFRVGESLIPNCMPILERMGVLDRVRAHGFQPKHGVTFHDQERGFEHTIWFRDGRPWPNFTYDVHRAEFDALLLAHAAEQPGVTLWQPAEARDVALDGDGATVRVRDADGERAVRARFVVDATGRDALLGSRVGRRHPHPSLGKVALFAYFRGARRFPGRAEGNVRIYLFPEGWFWWIPLARDETSVGCVLHARTVRARPGSLEDLFWRMTGRCERVRDGLRGAERVTPIHVTSNIAYRIEPVVGDRFLCVGDAMAFLDPIFSPGVFLAMVSGERAAREILAAFADGRFVAERFAGYARGIEEVLRPLATLIEHFYDPMFHELFLNPPRGAGGMVDAVTFVLAGGSAMGRTPPRLRFWLAAFLALVRMQRWVRERLGTAVESRLEW